MSIGRAARTSRGTVMFGPYRLLPPGEYRARFRLKGVGSRVDLEVVAQGGRDDPWPHPASTWPTARSMEAPVLVPR